MEPDRENAASRSHGIPPDRAEYVRRVAIALLLIAGALVVWRLLDLLLLVFGAILVAILLRAIADPIARRTGMPRSWSLTATVLGLSVLIVLIIGLFGTQLYSQIAALSAKLPDAWREIRTEIGETDTGRQFLHWLQAAAFDLDAKTFVARFAISLTNALGGLIVIIAGGIYFAAQPALYRRGILLLFPHASRDQAGEILDKVAGALKLWLVGQSAIMVLVGTLTGLGAWIIGLPAPVALGLLAGLLEFIPFVGPILTAVPALLLALAISPQMALWTLLLLTVIQQSEGNVITPLVQREVVALPPALTLFALIAMGILLGPLGLLLSAPLTVASYVMVGELYVRRKLGDQTDLTKKLDALPQFDDANCQKSERTKRRTRPVQGTGSRHAKAKSKEPR